MLLELSTEKERQAFTRRETAKMWGVSEGLVIKLDTAGKIKTIRIDWLLKRHCNPLFTVLLSIKNRADFQTREDGLVAKSMQAHTVNRFE